MSKRFYFLMFVVLAFSGLVAATPLDVNNHSFELQNDGTPACFSGGSIAYCMGWEEGSLPGFNGRRVRCDLPSGTCGKCGDEDEPVPDGYVIGWVGKGGDGYQIVPDVFFEVGKRYTLGMESLGWDGHGLTVSLFYGVYDEDANEVASRTFYYDAEDAPLDWTYEHIELVSIIEAGAPCIGETIGIRLVGAGGGTGSNGYIYFDIVTLDVVWAAKAWGPDPKDDSDEVDKDVVALEWSTGLWATDVNGHEVYFGTSFAEVNEADNTDITGIYRGAPDVNYYDPPETLELIQTYYWRIDEVNEAFVGPAEAAPDGEGRWKGDIWSFEIEGRAKNPNPADGAADVSLTVELSWTAGRDALSHDVYFGSDYSSVTDANTSSGPDLYRGPQGTTTYDPPEELVFGETCYWRIDEVSASKVCKGYTWSFTINDHGVVDDMESYIAYSNDIYDTWLDYWTNGTGAELNINTDVNFVRDGNSMLYEYNNTRQDPSGDYGSVAEASVSDLEIGPDWTLGGAKALVLYFYGQEDNSATVNDRMYVALSDGTDVGVVYHPDVNTLAEEEWHEWNIDFEDFNSEYVDMTNVSNIAIGFGVYGGSETQSGGTGEVYIDSIGTYPTRCAASVSALYGDSDGDCIVDGIDLSAVSRDWLDRDHWIAAIAPDANYLQAHYTFEEGSGPTTANIGTLGSSHDGTLGLDPCDPSWITDDPCAPHERCLDFDSLFSEHVEIPGFNLTTNTATYTAWVKRSGNQSVFTPIFANMDDNDPDPDDPSAITLAGLFFGSAGAPSWDENNELTYYWRGDSWDFHTGMIVPDGLWTFIAATIAPDEAIVYMYDGTMMSSLENTAPHGIRYFDGMNRIGGFVNATDKLKFVKGRIDDVRFYDYTLSAGEVLYIAADPTALILDELEDWRMDIDDSGAVDFGDFAIQADYWLQEILFP